MKPDTKAIRARADAALKGPWTVFGDNKYFAAFSITSDERDVNGNPIDVGPDCNYEMDHSVATRREDVEFMAAARTDVPALCDRVEALEAALRALELRHVAIIGRPDTYVQLVDVRDWNARIARSLEDR